MSAPKNSWRGLTVVTRGRKYRVVADDVAGGVIDVLDVDAGEKETWERAQFFAMPVVREGGKVERTVVPAAVEVGDDSDEDPGEVAAPQVRKSPGAIVDGLLQRGLGRFFGRR